MKIFANLIIVATFISVPFVANAQFSGGGSFGGGGSLGGSGISGGGSTSAPSPRGSGSTTIVTSPSTTITTQQGTTQPASGTGSVSVVQPLSQNGLNSIQNDPDLMQTLNSPEFAGYTQKILDNRRLWEQEMELSISSTPSLTSMSESEIRKDVENLLSKDGDLEAFRQKGGSPYDDLLRQLITPDMPPLPNPEVFVQQTVPGTPTGGSSAPNSCSDCGGAQMSDISQSQPDGTTSDGRSGPICPATICDEPLIGCGDEWCGFPLKGHIPLDTQTARSTIKYQRNGFPEVVVMGLISSDLDKKPSCTGTAVGNKWILTAMHCLIGPKDVPVGKGPKAALKILFDEAAVDVPGWTKLTVKDVWSARFFAKSGELEEWTSTRTVYIPYASLEDVEPVVRPEPNKGIRTPTRDLVLLKLDGEGLPFKLQQLPWLANNDYAALDEPISFAGYGWTTADARTAAEWEGLWGALEWNALFETSFNFSTGLGTFGNSSEPMISWKQGTLGGNGGPCRFDSGGPVYGGFNRGFWNDPRLLVGVVSATYQDGALNRAADCLNPNAVSVAEDIRPYHADLCAISEKEIKGCSQ